MYTQDAGLTGSNGRRSKAAAAAVVSTESSTTDDDDAGKARLPPASTSSRPPTSFQERVASAKLAAASKRSTPATSSTSRLDRRQDSLTTLNSDKLANLLGAKTTLCSLVPAGLDTRTSSDDYLDGEDAATTPTRTRARMKRRSRRTTAEPGSSDDEQRATKDRETKSKRKQKVDKVDVPVSAAGDDDEVKQLASSKANDDRKKKHRDKVEKDGHRKTKKDVVAEQSTTTKTRRQRAAAADILPVFNLGEYPATRTEPSPRLNAIKKSVERAHKNQRLVERKSPHGAGRGGRRGRGEGELGTRKTLQTNALLDGKSHFVKLKVDTRLGVVERILTQHYHGHRLTCHCRWRRLHLTLSRLFVLTIIACTLRCCSLDIFTVVLLYLLVPTSAFSLRFYLLQRLEQSFVYHLLLWTIYPRFLF